MKRISRKKGWALVTLLLLGGLIAWLALSGTQSFDTRFNGAYRLDDGRLVIVTPREGETLRYRMTSGESRALWPVGDRIYEAGPGWSQREPVEVTVDFDASLDGEPPAGSWWTMAGGSRQRAERIALPERFVTLTSGEVTLRGKLVQPLGEPPFPVVVLVHGSGRESAVDSYYMPYLFAARGIATLVYDKRGTGGSSGRYLQNFHVLADDVLAAVRWLRSQPDIDATRIHLSGYSQGGWIAPLAASRTEGIRSLLINYGPMVPVTEEDRWGYVSALRQGGFGEAEIAEVDRINAVLGAIFDRGENRWSELDSMLEEAEGREWYEALRGSDSLLGFLTETPLPLWAMRLFGWWLSRGDVPFIDRLYDPVPTMSSLEVPSLWLLGGEDSSMPTDWTIEKLEALQEQGRPIEIEVFPGAEHGILTFEDDDSGNREYRGYSPGYMDRQVDWLLRQSAP